MCWCTAARTAGYISLLLFLIHGSDSSAFAGDTPTSARKDNLVIEDFSGTPVGSLPRGWGWRDKDEEKPKLYEVEEINGRRYLAAQDSGSSVILLKRIVWNLREYPILTWCWKVDVLPPGADERYTETNDSAAGVYVIFSTNWLGIPHQLKYVWSTTLPPGTVGRRKGIARPWFVVLESGAARQGQWTFEQVDLLRDYERVLGGKPKDRTIGIGVLTDANSTHSYARAAYADFRVWTREAFALGRIENYCDCFAESTASETPGDSGE